MMTRFGYGQSSTVTCAAEIKGQRTDHFQSHVDHNSGHGFVVVVGVDSARALFTNGRRRLQGQVYKVVASAPGRACQTYRDLLSLGRLCEQLLPTGMGDARTLAPPHALCVRTRRHPPREESHVHLSPVVQST
ncbi:hypothetical protein AX14_005995 [Amanita brunnescens Koide BX004]|nr:hypothetical protein AX14_005995 [Amanita brunnescens Koide BX004]